MSNDKVIHPGSIDSVVIVENFTGVDMETVQRVANFLNSKPNRKYVTFKADERGTLYSMLTDHSFESRELYVKFVHQAVAHALLCAVTSPDTVNLILNPYAELPQPVVNDHRFFSDYIDYTEMTMDLADKLIEASMKFVDENASTYPGFALSNLGTHIDSFGIRIRYYTLKADADVNAVIAAKIHKDYWRYILKSLTREEGVALGKIYLAGIRKTESEVKAKGRNSYTKIGDRAIKIDSDNWTGSEEKPSDDGSFSWKKLFGF